jgi:hyperosmotically inducible periplasmic protein
MTQFINRSVLAVVLGVLAAGSVPAKDVSLADRVRHELNMLPYYGVFDAISYEVNGDAVTLSGAVHYPMLASDAANVVKNITGVGSVSNQIEVLPLSRFDDQIRLAAWRTLYSWPTMSRVASMPLPPVRILVKNGDITLVGMVPTQADKDALGLRANGIPNVFSVKNELVVENPPVRKS